MSGTMVKKRNTSSGSGVSQSTYSGSGASLSPSASANYIPGSSENYFDRDLSAADKQLMSVYKAEWDRGYEIGDQGLMNSAHAAAEALRAQYGYSGGQDGSRRILLEPMILNTGNGGGGQSYGPSRESYINSIIEAQKEAAIAALTSAYQKNLIALNSAAQRIPGMYQDARNQTAGQSEVSRQNFNSYAAAAGLNSGAGGQVSLSMSNALSGNLNTLNKEEANARKDIEAERARLKIQYNNAIAQAESSGNMTKAEMLYNESVRVDESVQRAAELASEYKFKYTQLLQNDSQFSRELYQKNQQFNQQLNYQSSQADQQFNNNLFLKNQEADTKMRQSIIQLAIQSGDFSALADYGYSQDQINNLTRNWKLKNKVYY